MKNREKITKYNNSKNHTKIIKRHERWIFCPDLRKLRLLCKLHKIWLILRIMIKIDAIRCQVLRLKCTKIVYGWGSAPDPAGGAYDAPPDSRLGGDQRLRRLHSRAFGTRLAFAVPYLCPWRRLCLCLLCKLHEIWSVDSRDNH